jgi:hypothetical protein
MMNTLEEIAARKQQLLQQSQSERSEISRIYYQWQARTLVARQVTGILKNPFVLAGIGTLLLKMPWRRAFRLGGWAWKGWKLLRIVRRVWI